MYIELDMLKPFQIYLKKIQFKSLDEIKEYVKHPCHKRVFISKKKYQYKFINFSQIVNNSDFIYNKFNGNKPKSNVILHLFR